MIKEPWNYDQHSHRVILNVGHDRASKRQRKEISIASNILNSPRLVVLIIVIAILIALFLKEARLVLASSPRFIIQDIILENTNLINPVRKPQGAWLSNGVKNDNLTDILKLKNNKGLFNISTKKIIKILEKDPDIESAKVEKILPGTLKIVINERVPYAKLKIEDKVYFIDNNGIVLLRERDDVSIPIVSGLKIKKLVPGESCTTPELGDVLNILCKGESLGWSKFVEIANIDVHNGDYISIHTRERITIKLDLDNIYEQLDKLIFILNDVQRRGKLINMVDLRFKDVYVE